MDAEQTGQVVAIEPAADRAPADGWWVRTAREGDAPQLFELARRAGGGMTNLPSDREAIDARVAWSVASCAKPPQQPQGELYLLVLEEVATGRIAGTSCIFSRVGAQQPFYSYRLSTLAQGSAALRRSATEQILHLTNDFAGATEVGGLFLDPALRAAGLGRLLARSRYLFIAEHRERFADRVLAELRGWTDADGVSPFWEAVGRRFFDMPFEEADRFGAVHGNQFIADLMPKLPIYVCLLPIAAQRVIGKVHENSAGALRMLEAEGFAFEGYVDIFDAGPTVSCRTDQIRTVREAGELRLAGGPARDGRPALLSTGRLQAFSAWADRVERRGAELALVGARARPAAAVAGEVVRHAAL